MGRSVARGEFTTLRIITELVRSALTRRAAGLAIDRILLEAQANADSVDLAVEMNGAVVDSRRAPLAIEHRARGLGLTSLTVEAGGSARRFDGGPIVIVPTVSEESDGIVVAYRFVWKTSGDRDMRSVLLLPNALPRVLGSAPQARPLAVIECSARGLDMVCGPVSDRGPLQVAVCRTSAVEEVLPTVDGIELMVTTGLVRACGRRALATVGKRVADVLGGLEWRFGSQAARQVVLALPGEVHAGAWGARGCVLESSPENLGVSGRFEEPNHFRLAAGLASLWWGTGCRVSGRYGIELENTLAWAAALDWTEAHGGPAAAGRVLLHYQRRRAIRARDAAARARGHPRTGVVFENAFRLYRAIRRDTALQRAVAELTTACWGRWTPEGHLSRNLADLGIQLTD